MTYQDLASFELHNLYPIQKKVALAILVIGNWALAIGHSFPMPNCLMSKATFIELGV